MESTLRFSRNYLVKAKRLLNEKRKTQAYEHIKKYYKNIIWIKHKVKGEKRALFLLRSSSRTRTMTCSIHVFARREG